MAKGKVRVWEAIEKFQASIQRPEHWRLPVDIFSIVELELKMDIIPFPKLLDKYNRDAALTPDFKGIYVDEDSYTVWETGRPVWKHRRLRFSVAHELGHCSLHKEEAAGVHFSSLEEFGRWLNADDSELYSREQAANEFAGRLLVPQDALGEMLNAFADEVEGRVPQWRVMPEYRKAFAERIAPKFEVNSQVVEVRLDREGIWAAT